MSENKTEKVGFFSKLRDGMKKTRDQIADAIGQVFPGKEIDDEFYDDLEAAMITADMGTKTTTAVVEALKKRVKAEHLKTAEQVRSAVKQELVSRMDFPPFAFERPCVLLVVGVNGAGKTTSIGKIANYYRQQGLQLLIAAADTFRAAAAEQLSVWARRADVPLIRHEEGSDPAAVVYDAISAGKARHADLIIVDTAGRLHNKTHLMEELKKMRRVIEREHPTAQIQVLLVIDGTTGQNGLSQAKAFGEAIGLDAVVLTKLDGTAKGGVAIAVYESLGLPVAFIMVGEAIDDIQPFDPKEYIDSIL